MHNLRTLITGGAGFVGSHLVDQMIREGHEVVVLDNCFSGSIENVKHQLDSGELFLIKGDVRDSEVVKRLCGMWTPFFIYRHRERAAVLGEATAC